MRVLTVSECNTFDISELIFGPWIIMIGSITRLRTSLRALKSFYFISCAASVKNCETDYNTLLSYGTQTIILPLVFEGPIKTLFQALK